MPAFGTVLSLLAALALCVAGESGDGAFIPQGYSPISRNACPAGDVLSRGPAVVPRLTLPFLAAVPADLGGYGLFSCSGEGAERRCELKPSLPSDLAALPLDPLVARPAGDPVRYVQGIVSYAVVSVALAILTPILAVVVLLLRYSCLCCCKPGRCVCLRCGLGYPTKKHCCEPGFRRLKDGRLGYTPCERWCAFAFQLATVSLLFGLMLSANFSGNWGISAGLRRMVDPQEGLGAAIAGLVRSSLPPTTDLLVDVSSEALAPALLGLNATLSRAGVDLPATRASLECVNRTMDALPNITVARTFVGQLQTMLLGSSPSGGGGGGGGSPSPSIRGSVVQLSALVEGLGASQAAVVGNATGLLGEMGTLGAQFDVAMGALDGAQTASVAMVSAKNELLAPGAGLLPRALADFVALFDDFPAEQTFLDASGEGSSTAGFGTLNRIAAGLMTGGGNPLVPGHPAEVFTLVARLQGIANQLGALPNFNTTADVLEQINDVLQAVGADGGPLEGLSTALDALAGALAAVPRSDALAPWIFGIVDTAQALDLNPLAGTLNTLADQLAALPDFGPLLFEIGRVRGVAQVIPCLKRVTAQLDGVNETLFELPSSLADMSTLLDSINSTISDALSSIDGVQRDVRKANETIADVTPRAYLSDISDVNATLVEQQAELNATRLVERLRTLDDGVNTSYVADVQAQLADFSVTIRASRIPQANITALRVFHIALTEISDTVRELSVEYWRLGQGFCTGAPLRLCNSTADCGASGGTCTRNAKSRCWDATGGGQTQACDHDSDCANSDEVCLGDPMRAAAASAAFQGAGNLRPDVSASLDAVRANDVSAAGTDVDRALQGIADARSAMDDIDISSYSDTLRDLIDGVRDGFTPSSVQSELSSALRSIDDVPFASFTDQLDDVRGTVEDLQGKWKPVVISAADAVSGLNTLLSKRLHGIAAALSRPALAPVGTSDGLAGVVRSIGHTLDGAVGVLRGTGSDVFLDIPAPNLEGMADPIDPFSDRLYSVGDFADTGVAANGPLYYLASLALPWDSLVHGDDPAAFSLLTDASGARYSKGRVCLTSKCLQQVVTVLSTAPVGSWGQALPFLPALPIPLSRETILALPLIAPLIVAILGLWGLIAPWCCPRCCCTRPQWSKVPTSCMVGAAVCQIPFLFLITAPMFLFLLAIGDVCNTGPNVGLNLLLSMQDGVCSLAGGIGSASACSFGVNVTVPAAAPGLSPLSLRLGTTVNIPGAYADLFGDAGCPALGSTSDNIASALEGIAASLASAPVTAASSFLDSAATNPSLTGGLRMREPVRALVLDAVNATSLSVARFIRSLSASAASCASVSAAITDVRDAVCCQLVPSAWWYVFALFLSGWAMLVCVIPAGCLGRKRLQARPWGPVVAKLLQKAEDGHQADVLEANAQLVEEWKGLDTKSGKLRAAAEAANAAAGAATEAAAAATAAAVAAVASNSRAEAARREMGLGRGLRRGRSSVASLEAPSAPGASGAASDLAPPRAQLNPLTAALAAIAEGRAAGGSLPPDAAAAVAAARAGAASVRPRPSAPPGLEVHIEMTPLSGAGSAREAGAPAAATPAFAYAPTPAPSGNARIAQDWGGPAGGLAYPAAAFHYSGPTPSAPPPPPGVSGGPPFITVSPLHGGLHAAGGPVSTHSPAPPPAALRPVSVIYRGPSLSPR